MPALESVDESFLTNAPVVVGETISVPLSADAVWRELTNDTTLRWLAPGLRVIWGSPRAGVGAVRRIGPVIGPKAQERYFLWEEGRRKAFYMVKPPLPLPGLRAFAEDYIVTPTPQGSEFTWVWAIDGSGLVRRVAPVVRAIVGFGMKRTQRHLAKLAEAGTG